MIKGPGVLPRQASSKSEHRGVPDRFSGWWSNDALLATCNMINVMLKRLRRLYGKIEKKQLHKKGRKIMLFFKKKKAKKNTVVFPDYKQKTEVSFHKLKTPPMSYVVFDFETTGLSRDSEIIEIGAVKVDNGTVVDSYSRLIKPDKPVPDSAIAIHGITNEMLAHEADVNQVLREFIQYSSGYPLIGYNITTYDIPVMQRTLYELGVSCSGNYYDVLDMAREKLPNLENKKLRTVASYLCIVSETKHRALDDCIMTNEVFKKLCSDNVIDQQMTRSTRPKKYHVSLSNATLALQDLQFLITGIIADNEVSEEEVLTLNQWLLQNEELEGQYPFDRVFNIIRKTLEDGVVDDQEKGLLLKLFKEYIDPVGAAQQDGDQPECVFCDNTFVLTGDFENGSRKEVEEKITNAGGIIRGNVSGKTAYVVVGALGSPDWSNGNYGSKIKKAMELKENGKPIRIITEEQLFNALDKG